MPRVFGNLAAEYVEEQKKMNKIEKLESELKGLNNRLEEKQNEFNTYSAMNREELIEAMKEDKMFGWRYEAWETRGDVEVLEEGIRSMKNWHIEWPKRDIKNLTKQITKIATKIYNLK